MYILYTFHSTHSALYAEKSVLQAGCKIKIIPVPRAISSSCGLAARIDKGQFPIVQQILAEKEIEVDGIYTMDSNNNISSYNE